MKLILVRRTDTIEYEGNRNRWVLKCPRTFGRWCDFTNHYKYSADGNLYLGVDYSNIELIEINLEDMSTKTIPFPKYLDKIWERF